MSFPILAILIPTVDTRRDDYFLPLCAKLREEIPDDRLIILHEPDAGENNGGPPIGAKRTHLVIRAVKHIAKYVMHVDDDDELPPGSLLRIMAALEQNPDVVGIEGDYHDVENDTHQKFIHSRQYTTSFEEGGILYRCPNHLNPIRTEIAACVPFPPLSMGEDRAYSMGLRAYLRGANEIMLDGVCSYIYNYRRIKPEMRAK